MRVRELARRFQDATRFNSAIGAWDVSSVTDVFAMFEAAAAFNADLRAWDLSSVTEMRELFLDATSFEGGLGIFFSRHRARTACS